MYPPHTVALGSVYLAALLSSFEQPITQEPPGYNNGHQIADILGKNGKWEDQFMARVEDLEGLSPNPDSVSIR
jgi:CTD kinase subunit beta